MDEDEGRRSAAADLFAGIGLGLLLGTVVGLSTSPVVAIVVGALTSLLAVFLGLDAGGAMARGLVRVNALRIGAFGVATVAGLIGGLYVRVNNPIAAAPDRQLARWTAAFPDDPTLAKQLMIYERTGIAPARFTFGAEPPAEPVEVTRQEGAEARAPVLFSSELRDFDACARLSPERFANPEASLAAYTRRGAPAALGALADQLADWPVAERDTAIAAAYQTLCALQRGDAQ